MKIQEAGMALYSENQLEQLDLSINEKKRKNGTGQSNNRPDPTPTRLNDFQPLSGMRVDRVSISQTRQEEYQSNYSASISSRSTVSFSEPDKTVDYSQDHAMEKLVGGIINKEVVIRKIQRKEDVEISENGTAKSAGLSENSIPDQENNAGLKEWQMSLNRTDIHFEDQTVLFSSKGQVITQDGRTIDFSLDLDLNRSFLSRTQEKTLIHRWQENVVLTDPLVISLDGKVPQLSDTRFEFDLDSDNTMETVNFVSPGSGFLAFDKNDDNQINNGSELFGPGTGNGFEELAAYDLDKNNWIDENDAIFSKLSVWTKNEQGEDQLISLKDAGLGAIALDYAETKFDYTQTDHTLQGKLQRTGAFLFEDGRAGTIQQIDLASHKPEPEVGQSPVSAQEPSKIQPVAEQPVFPSVPAMKQPPPAEISNPLEDLLDRIEKLKEEMGRLYENMNPLTGREGHGRKRHGIGSRRYYQDFRMDPSILLSGRHKGRARFSGRYV